MNSSTLRVFLILCAFCISAADRVRAEDQERLRKVVIDQYKLYAVQGIHNAAVREYLRGEPDPQRKCVVFSIESEYSAQLVFVARRVSRIKLEILCFVPGAKAGQEWHARYLDYDGEAKEQFLKLHDLLGKDNPTLAEMAKLKLENKGDMKFAVGDGVAVAEHSIDDAFIEVNPELEKRLLACIGIMESLAQVKVTE